MARLKKEITFILLTAVLIFVSGFYYYCYIAEHTILAVKQDSIIKPDVFTINSICKAVDAFTFAPYVSVKLNNFEVLTTAVTPGYDTLGDCLSSIEQVQILEIERKLQIHLKSGEIKKVDIIYYNSK